MWPKLENLGMAEDSQVNYVTEGMHNDLAASVVSRKFPSRIGMQLKGSVFA